VLPDPKHVILYENAIEFAMSPWWNLDDLRNGGSRPDDGTDAVH